jgi:hypothetical protein
MKNKKKDIKAIEKKTKKETLKQKETSNHDNN